MQECTLRVTMSIDEISRGYKTHTYRELYRMCSNYSVTKFLWLENFIKYSQFLFLRTHVVTTFILHGCKCKIAIGGV